MSPLRLLVLAVFAYLALRLIGRWLNPPARSDAARRPTRGGHLVKCAACGMFVAQDRALLLGGRGFCSTRCVEKISNFGA